MEKVKQFLNKNSHSVLWLFVFLYTVFFTLIFIWKYNNFLYNALDLAIFNQVFWNSSFGRFFEFSIHPHSYFGDHFTPFIILLLPAYSLFRSPIALLFLQSLFIALSAVPVYLITKEVFKKHINKSIIGLCASLFFLINPIIWNINFFEFHIVSFSIFFLLFAFYFYQIKKFFYFIVSLILALSIREDVSPVVFMFGFLPLLTTSLQCNKIKGKILSLIFNKWALIPIIISTVWFFLSNHIISLFNPESSYKFLIYYQWMGESHNLFDLIKNITTHPLKVFIQLFSLESLVVSFVVFSTFLFLPLFKARYLLLALGPFLQIFLSGGTGILYSTHYIGLFVPALVIGSIFGAEKFLGIRKLIINKNYSVNNSMFVNIKDLWNIIVKDKYLLILISIVAIIYSCIVIGPVVGVFKKINNTNIKNKSTVSNFFIDKMPDNASVVLSNTFSSNLSNREELYPLHYGFWGKAQFSDKDYIFPDTVDYYLLDFSSFITYKLHSSRDDSRKLQYSTGGTRLKKYLDNYGVVGIVDDVALFKRGHLSDIKLVEFYDKNNIDKNVSVIKTGVTNGLSTSSVSLVGYGRHKKNQSFDLQDNLSSSMINYSFYWDLGDVNVDGDDVAENPFFEIEIFNKDNKSIFQKVYPMFYGIHSLSSLRLEMPLLSYVKTNHWLLIPNKFLKKDNSIYVNIVDFDGFVGIGDIREAENYIRDRQIISKTIIDF